MLTGSGDRRSGARYKTAINVAFLFVASLFPRAAFAHSMYQSSILLDFHRSTVDAELQLPPPKLQVVFGTPLSPEKLADLQVPLSVYILQRFGAHDPQGAPWRARFTQPLYWTTIDGAPYIVAKLSLAPPSGRPIRRFVLEDNVITDSIPSHAVLVTVRSDWSSSTFANDPELIGIITGSERAIPLDRASGTWTTGFRSVFLLGVRHIAEGTDHLLFLLALLLPSPLLVCGRRWSGFAGVRHGANQILRVVTAFTVGHSVTLALAATGVVNVPGHPIEVLIAVSILVSAIHAIRPLFPGREAVVAASFGLIHGLAFASTLGELGLQGLERAESIFSFNLGIEAMQLVVVLCVMPSLMLLSRTKLYPAFRISGALFAGTAAAGWVVERTSGASLQIDRIVNILAVHSGALALALLGAALFTSRIPSLRSPRKSAQTLPPGRACPETN